MAKLDLQTIDILHKGLTILNTLMAGGAVSKRDLMEKTGLGERQIRRYLNTLRELDIPIVDVPGAKEKRFALMPGARQRFQILPFSPEELVAVYFHASLTGRVRAGALADQLETVCQKIQTHLGSYLYDLPKMQAAFLPLQKGYKAYDPPDVQENFARLLQGLTETRACTVHYQKLYAEQAKRYTLHPYQLCAYQGGLYVYAYLPSRQHVMVQSVERIRSVTVTDSVFQRDQAILDAIQAMRDRAFGILDDGEVLHVVLRFSPEQARYVAERVWHPSQEIAFQQDGALIMRFDASGRYEIIRWVSGWGPDVEVLEPAEVREEVRHRLNAAVRGYNAHQGK